VNTRDSFSRKKRFITGFNYSLCPDKSNGEKTECTIAAAGSAIRARWQALIRRARQPQRTPSINNFPLPKIKKAVRKDCLFV
jgi:hypothetical protein